MSGPNTFFTDQRTDILYVAAPLIQRHPTHAAVHALEPDRRNEGKKLAIVACMRKLLVALNAMMRDASGWQSRALDA